MSGNINKNIKKKAPFIGELINPIVLAKKETTPDDDVGFTRKLKPYRNARAKIIERNRETSDPSLDFHEDITHEFIIRTHINEKIEAHVDVVLHDGYIYYIQYVTRVADGIPYVKLVCTKDQEVPQYQYTAQPMEPEQTNSDDSAQFPEFGKW